MKNPPEKPDHRWDIHEDAPTDDDGFPVHPERDIHICGRPKSKFTTPTNHGRERDEYAYCLLAAGWGTDDDHRGKSCSKHGGSGGGAEGPRNGNWKLGLYSDYFTPEEQERAEEWLELASGDRLTIEDFTRMGEKALLYEFTRLERAMREAPAPDVTRKYACKYCGAGLATEQIMVCPKCETTIKPDDIVPVQEWVELHDRQISERLERWVDMLKKYKEVVRGEDLNVNLGVSFEDAIRRAQDVAEADPEEKVEFMYGEQEE